MLKGLFDSLVFQPCISSVVNVVKNQMDKKNNENQYTIAPH